MNAPLDGCVALVAGATRGGGRAIALELAAAGAAVVVTGRSSRAAGASPMGRPETIEETAERARAAGGRATAHVVDHADPEQVAALVARVRADHGRLDVLVNGVWGGDPLVQWGRKLWEHPLDDTLALLRQGIETHVITSRHALPLLIESGGRLVVEVTDGTTDRYRGNLPYDLVKHAVIRLAVAQAAELRPHGIAAVAVSPGFLRSEAMLDHFGVTEATWREAIAQDPHFAQSETPRYLGRAIAALAADPDVMRFSGRAVGTWDLAKVYGFTDVDGRQPDWGGYFEREIAPTLGEG